MGYCFKNEDPGSGNEEARTICRIPETGELVWGNRSAGTHTSVSINPACPQGGEAWGLFHTHPGGVSEPSAQDISEFKKAKAQLGIARFCIKNGKMSCFEVK